MNCGAQGVTVCMSDCGVHVFMSNSDRMLSFVGGSLHVKIVFFYFRGVQYGQNMWNLISDY